MTQMQARLRIGGETGWRPIDVEARGDRLWVTTGDGRVDTWQIGPPVVARSGDAFSITAGRQRFELEVDDPDELAAGLAWLRNGEVSDRERVLRRRIRLGLNALAASIAATALALVIVVGIFGDGFNAIVPGMMVLFFGGAVAIPAALAAAGLGVALTVERRHRPDL